MTTLVVLVANKGGGPSIDTLSSLPCFSTPVHGASWPLPSFPPLKRQLPRNLMCLHTAPSSCPQIGDGRMAHWHIANAGLGVLNSRTSRNKTFPWAFAGKYPPTEYMVSFSFYFQSFFFRQKSKRFTILLVSAHDCDIGILMRRAKYTSKLSSCHTTRFINLEHQPM